MTNDPSFYVRIRDTDKNKNDRERKKRMIRFGVIGTNWITERFIEASREVDGFLLSAVCSRTAERAEQFARKHQIPHRFTDLEQMAASSVIDAVYIASPNAFHAEQAIVCMNQGKHVLCEKPVASNRSELERMIEAADRNEVVLMEALKSTLMPNFQAIAEHMGKLGAIRRFMASFCKYSSRYDDYRKGVVRNAFDPTLSNGSLMDLGIYCIYPMVVLFGEPLRIQAHGVLLSSGADGEGSILAQYEGMEAVLMHSKISDSTLPCEIQGEDGTIVIDKISEPHHIEIHYRDGSSENISVLQAAHSMRYEVEEFIGLIHRGERQSRVNSHAHSLAAMGVMDEARRQIGLVYPADRRV